MSLFCKVYSSFLQVEDRCKYYVWQRQYFEELLDAKIVQVALPKDQCDEDALESVTQPNNTRSLAELKIGSLEEKLDKLVKVVILLVFIFVVLFAVMLKRYV